jgi:hypothetical protein
VQKSKQLYPKDGGGMGIIVVLFLSIPTVLLLYGMFMQIFSPLWLHAVGVH